MQLNSKNARSLSGFSDAAPLSSRVPGVIPFKWEEEPGKPKEKLPSSKLEDSEDEAEADGPRVVQLNLKASLMGVHVLDDEEVFFSRQSSLSSVVSGNNYRSAGAVPFKWEAEPGKPIEPVPKSETPLAPLLPPPGSRAHSGMLFPQGGAWANSGMLYPQGGSRAHSGMLYPQGGSQAHSGMLFPYPPAGNRDSSGTLNAAYFTFRGGLGPDATESGGPNLTEKIFRKLVGQSRLSMSNEKTGETSSENRDRQSDHDGKLYDSDDSESPVSTLEYLPESGPATPSSSEDSYIGKHIAPPPPPNRPTPQLPQCFFSLTDMDDSTEDKFILEGPSEVAWHQPEEKKHYARLPVLLQSRPPRRKPNQSSEEHWPSSSSSWTLPRVQKPLKTVSSILSGSKPKGDRSKKTVTYVEESIIPTSGDLPYIRSGNAHCRQKDEMEKGPLQHDLESEVCDTREEVLQTVDEEDFPFESPIASRFVFGDAQHSRLSTDSTGALSREIPQAVGTLVEEDSDFDVHADSISLGSDDFLTSSFERRPSGTLDQPQWVPTKSFHYITEVGDDHALTSYLEISQSSRFSIDLQTGPRLERNSVKEIGSKSSDTHLRRSKSDADYRHTSSHPKWSMLSPCLPFLDRSKSSKAVPRLHPAPGPSLQPVDSFVARLGPLNQKSSTGPFQFY